MHKIQTYVACWIFVVKMLAIVKLISVYFKHTNYFMVGWFVWFLSCIIKILRSCKPWNNIYSSNSTLWLFYIHQLGEYSPTRRTMASLSNAKTAQATARQLAQSTSQHCQNPLFSAKHTAMNGEFNSNDVRKYAFKGHTYNLNTWSWVCPERALTSY